MKSIEDFKKIAAFATSFGLPGETVFYETLSDIDKTISNLPGKEDVWNVTLPTAEQQNENKPYHSTLRAFGHTFIFINMDLL